MERNLKYKEIFGKSLSLHSHHSKNGKRNVERHVKDVKCKDDAVMVPPRRSERLQIKSKPDYSDTTLKASTKVKKTATSREEAIYFNKENKYKCENCPASYAYKCSLKKHIMSNHYVNLYECDVCGETFLRKDSVKRHKDHKHFSEVSKSECLICFKSFDYKSNLQKHIRLYHSNV